MEFDEPLGDLLECEPEDVEPAPAICSQADRFVKLPSQWDIHEWEIMREFASEAPPGIRDELLDALHGSGAFRHFKSTLRHHRFEDEWFAFRAQALRDIAAEWCEDEAMEYCE